MNCIFLNWLHFMSIQSDNGNYPNRVHKGEKMIMTESRNDVRHITERRAFQRWFYRGGLFNCDFFSSRNFQHFPKNEHGWKKCLISSLHTGKSISYIQGGPVAPKYFEPLKIGTWTRFWKHSLGLVLLQMVNFKLPASSQSQQPL